MNIKKQIQGKIIIANTIFLTKLFIWIYGNKLAIINNINGKKTPTTKDIKEYLFEFLKVIISQQTVVIRNPSLRYSIKLLHA